MLAVTRGRLVALSTPWGRRGWFYTAWESDETWHRVRVTAEAVRRISADFLAEERRTLPAQVFAAEYDCEWTNATSSAFASADVWAALDDDLEPLFAAPA